MKEKKHKKQSKKKLKNKDKPRCESSSDSNESESLDEWEEKPAPTTSISKRDAEDASWIDITTTSTYSRKDLGLIKTKSQREEESLRKLGLDKPGQHAKELNPYWKDGGCGLPAASKSTVTSNSSTAVGDGGLKWLQKAYQRSKEQAIEENRSLEEVVAERWGSLENLERMIEEASDKAQSDSRNTNKEFSKSRDHHSYNKLRHSQSQDHRRHDSYKFETRTNDYRSSRHEQKKFVAPTDDDSYSYRDRNYASTSSSSTPRWKKKDDTGKFQDRQLSERDNSPSVNVKPEFSSTSSSVPRWKKKGVDSDKFRATESPQSNSPPTTDALPVPSSAPKLNEDKVSEEKMETSEELVNLTDKEMNELGAKIIKAELMGKTELANELKAKLDSARKYRDGGAKPLTSAEGRRTETEEVVLMVTDNKGFTRPLQSREGGRNENFRGGRSNKKQKVSTHDKDGVRERYFADDDKYSLKQMFEREKLSTAEDQDAMFARLAGRGVGKTSDEYDVDDVLTSRANRVVNEAKIEEGERLKAIMEYKKSSAAVERCKFCFDGKENPKHLIVAAGLKVYLRVTEDQSLTDGQCLIVPMQHVSGSTYLDEDVLSEIKIFQKGLTAMFNDKDLDVVYFETCMNLRRYPHMAIHCVPLPKDVGYLAPMYFKKAIMESETEWAHNKKLVEVNEKGVQRAVPKGLPYFSVEFGKSGGFAHVIEDEQLFPQTFAQEIIGGMLDLDPNAWRRPHRQQFEEQRKKVLDLSEWWRPYDWTKRLRDSD